MPQLLLFPLWPEWAFCGFWFELTNEPTLLPVAPHSEGCEFSQEIVKYRGIVEEAVFDCFGRPSFFGEVVEVAQRRVGETLKHLNPNTRTEEEFRRLIEVEARLLAREMEVQFLADRDSRSAARASSKAEKIHALRATVGR